MNDCARRDERTVVRSNLWLVHCGPTKTIEVNLLQKHMLYRSVASELFSLSVMRWSTMQHRDLMRCRAFCHERHRLRLPK
jgi:hypothetical protein